MEVRACGQEVAIRIAAGETQQDISVSLQQRHPSQRGFSSRSVRWFCSEEGIHYRCGLSDGQLDRVIVSQVQAVGHSYGRRTIHGLLNARYSSTSTSVGKEVVREMKCFTACLKSDPLRCRTSWNTSSMLGYLLKKITLSQLLELFVMFKRISTKHMLLSQSTTLVLV